MGVAGRQVLTIHATGSSRSSGEEESEPSEESSIGGARGIVGEWVGDSDAVEGFGSIGRGLLIAAKPIGVPKKREPLWGHPHFPDPGMTRIRLTAIRLT